MRHCTKKKHLEHLNTRKEHIALPTSWLQQNPDPADNCCPSNIPYSAASNIYEDATCPTMHNAILIKPVGLNDHILHTEALVL